jgi:uncharacterized repeat protein (TIGR01451 family)
MKASSAVSLGLLAALALGASQPPAPDCVNSSLLFVQFNGPKGLQVLFHQGEPGGRAYDAPVTVGLRPGYLYRVQLNNLPDHPGVTLFPTLEVRGMVAYPPWLNPALFPVPIVFSKADIERVLSGALITKVYYLENPCSAFAFATERDNPIELDVPPTQCIFDEARECGRIMVILRFGERQADDAELAQSAIPGTILLPGASAIAQPAVGPSLPWACWPLFDPRQGPPPLVEECICDGGDVAIPLALGTHGRLLGLDPSDAAAEYECLGCRKLAISNRCCLFAPRFVALRQELIPAGVDNVIQPEAKISTLAQITVEELQSPRIKVQIHAPSAVQGRIRPSEIDTVTGLLQVEQLIEPAVITGKIQTVEVVGVCIKEPPCGPLVLCKWCDAKAARVGDIVTFHLKYTNTGGQPMTNVIVSDSLTTRLEYVPGTALTDRDAVFTTYENQCGSLVLRWQVGGSLPPGQSGMIRFQARVR